jgi:signal-transduction protein with cAMP-binding, CBS, and nucleotidyltransferase domain
MVSEIMTKDVITISPEETIEEAAKTMAENKIKKLPVVEEGKIVGIITASDLIAFEEQLVKKLSELIVSPEVRNMGG